MDNVIMCDTNVMRFIARNTEYIKGIRFAKEHSDAYSMWSNKIKGAIISKKRYYEEEVGPLGMSKGNLKLLMIAAKSIGCKKGTFTSYGTYKAIF